MFDGVPTLRAPLDAEEPNLLPERRRRVKVLPPLASLSKEVDMASLLKEVLGRWS